MENHAIEEHDNSTLLHNVQNTNNTLPHNANSTLQHPNHAGTLSHHQNTSTLQHHANTATLPYNGNHATLPYNTNTTSRSHTMMVIPPKLTSECKIEKSSYIRGISIFRLVIGFIIPTGIIGAVFHSLSTFHLVPGSPGLRDQEDWAFLGSTSFIIVAGIGAFAAGIQGIIASSRRSRLHHGASLALSSLTMVLDIVAILSICLASSKGWQNMYWSTKWSSIDVTVNLAGPILIVDAIISVITLGTETQILSRKSPHITSID